MPRLAPLLVIVALVAATPLARAQLQPPRGVPGTTTVPPADPYQALSFFEGNWTIAGLPAGTRFDEACNWLATTRRHLVCRSRTESANGVQEGLGVFSYRATDGMYVYRSFDPNGEVDVLEGRLVGDNWLFSGTSGTAAAQRRTRMMITPGGERSFTLTQETAVGNGPSQPQPPVRYVPAAPATSSPR
jgi:hypothetical protein